MGKSILVTGANGGLAKETCKLLLQENHFEHLVMCGRSKQKIQQAKQELTENLCLDNNRVTTSGGFDMLNPEKLLKAINALPAEKPFDVVFLGAGGMVVADKKQEVSWHGHKFEKTIFQNVLGAHIALCALKQRGLLASGCRVVYAGGEGARGLPGFIKKPEFPTVATLKNYISMAAPQEGKYKPFDALGISKFVGALWCGKLAGLAGSGIDIIWFSPGFTHSTDGVDDMPPIKRWFMSRVMLPAMGLIGVAQPPSDGARKFADCITGKVGENGDLLGAPEGKSLGAIVDQKPMHSGFTDTAYQDAVWETFSSVIVFD